MLILAQPLLWAYPILRGFVIQGAAKVTMPSKQANTSVHDSGCQAFSVPSKPTPFKPSITCSSLTLGGIVAGWAWARQSRYVPFRMPLPNNTVYMHV